MRYHLTPMRLTPQKDEQVLASIQGKVGIPYCVGWNQSNPLGKVSQKAVSLWLSGFPSFDEYSKERTYFYTSVKRTQIS